ncbi:MAG: hypothetical protein RQ856_04435 [Candidatus Izemoplasmatales bacterium]|nr:hypothetical protein [Candidatus Izemoplasmatales bacterium]
MSVDDIRFTCYNEYIIYDEVEQFVYDYFHLKSTWVGAKIRDIEKLYDINDDVLGWIFLDLQQKPTTRLCYIYG